MDREEAAKHAGVIPESNLNAFLEYLVQYPGLPKILGAPHETEKRLQGDLFNALPCVHVNERGEAKVATFVVAVINNTCDLEPGRSKFVNVAPVFDFAAYGRSVIASRGEASAQGFLANVRANRVNELLFISECPGYSNGVIVMLDHISSISSKLYEEALAANGRIASFSQKGFYVFLLKITKFLARAEPAEVIRAEIPIQD